MDNLSFPHNRVRRTAKPLKMSTNYLMNENCEWSCGRKNEDNKNNLIQGIIPNGRKDTLHKSHKDSKFVANEVLAYIFACNPE